MVTLVLPTMVAGRQMADDLVDRLETGGDDVVVLDCRHLLSGSPSFAAQLVRRVLVETPAPQLRVEAATAPFAGYLREAAERLGVRERLSEHDTHSLPA